MEGGVFLKNESRQRKKKRPRKTNCSHGVESKKNPAGEKWIYRKIKRRRKTGAKCSGKEGGFERGVGKETQRQKMKN